MFHLETANEEQNHSLDTHTHKLNHSFFQGKKNLSGIVLNSQNIYHSPNHHQQHHLRIHVYFSYFWLVVYSTKNMMIHFWPFFFFCFDSPFLFRKLFGIETRKKFISKYSSASIKLKIKIKLV